MHHGPVLGGVLDYAGHPDADTEQQVRGEVGGAQHLGHGVPDVPHDDLDVVPLGPQRPFRAREFGQGEVEELDADPGLADVHADHVPAARRHLEQRARPAAVGVDVARLLQHPVREQVGDDVADRAGAQSGGRAQFEAAERAVEIEASQDGRAVVPPEIAHRAPVPPHHLLPLSTRSPTWNIPAQRLSSATSSSAATSSGPTASRVHLRRPSSTARGTVSVSMIR